MSDQTEAELAAELAAMTAAYMKVNRDFGEFVAVHTKAVDELRWLHAEAAWKLAQPCGSCHPCEHWVGEVWRRAGRTPPYPGQWDAARAREGAFEVLAEQHRAAEDVEQDRELAESTVPPGMDAFVYVGQSCADVVADALFDRLQASHERDKAVTERIRIEESRAAWMTEAMRLDLVLELHGIDLAPDGDPAPTEPVGERARPWWP